MESSSISSYPEIRLLIGGRWVEGGAVRPVINPATEEAIGVVPLATYQQMREVVQSAQKGQSIWHAMAPLERARIMLNAARTIREKVDEIATVMSLEQGKPIIQSRLEVLRACDIIEWDSSEGLRVYGRVIPAESGMRRFVTREPIGVVAGFTPWNFPFNSPARKVAGALAAGCAIILKPSEETPASAMLLVRAFVEAGLPEGVINLIFGDSSQISQFLIEHPVVRMITFTGSVPVGKHLAALAGREMKPTIMELGGHAPVIVCNDVDSEDVAIACAVAKARNAGQVCVSPTRFLVHEEVYKTFVDTFVARANLLKIGDPLLEETELGPLANDRRVQAIDALVADARKKGVTIASGGKLRESRGYFYPLTTFVDVPVSALAMSEEPFGPLALIRPVKSTEEGIRIANSLPVGLAGYAFTNDARNVNVISRDLNCGNIAINHFTASVAETPFGGVKDSGFGREGGSEGLEGYTVCKTVSHRL